MKTPICFPKIGVLGGLTSYNMGKYEQSTKKAHPRVSQTRLSYEARKSVDGVTCR